MKISDTTFENNPTYFTNPPFLWEVKSEPPPLKTQSMITSPYKGEEVSTMLQFFQVKKVTFTDWKIVANLKIDAFDFQLKFNLKYINFVLKEN